MFARVMHVQAKQGALDEVVTLYWQLVAPALQSQDGFHSTLLLTDPSIGSGMSNTIWKTEEARSASATNEQFLEQIRKVAPLLERPPKGENLVAHFGRV